MGGCIGGHHDAHAPTAAFGGIFRNQDGCFCQQANQHNHTCLQVDIVFQPEQLGEEERTHQAEGYGEDDGKRDEETLVEADHDEKH